MHYLLQNSSLTFLRVCDSDPSLDRLLSFKNKQDMLRAESRLFPTTRKVEFCKIGSKEAIDYILPIHYSGRRPNVSVAYCLKVSDVIVGVATFGKPASNTLCDGICGKENSKHVYELNRLVFWDEKFFPLSKFVSLCLRDLKKRNWIIVSYADTAMDHVGKIYQACNFLYTGCTKRRTVMYTSGNKHSRHCKAEEQGKFRKVRSAKHRYVYFAAKSKKQRKQWINALNYPVMPYPNGKSKRYKEGEYLVPEIIEVEQ